MNNPEFPQLGYLIRDVGRLLKRRFDENARLHGISLAQWRVLAQLSFDGALSQRALAKLIDSDPMTVSRMVERMEKAGLVDRVTDPQDSRAKLVGLTPQSEALIGRLRAVARRVFGEALQGFSDDEVRELTNGLERIRCNLSADAAPESEKKS